MFLKILSRMEAILHISHTYVTPLNPVGLLGLVDGGILVLTFFLHTYNQTYMLLKQSFLPLLLYRHGFHNLFIIT
jgi:hypothetical protein